MKINIEKVLEDYLKRCAVYAYFLPDEQKEKYLKIVKKEIDEMLYIWDK